MIIGNGSRFLISNKLRYSFPAAAALLIAGSLAKPALAEPPGTPTGVTATSSSNAILLAWLPSESGEPSYNVYMGTTPGKESDTPVQTGITNDDTLVTGLKDNETYYFEVTAVNDSGESPRSSEVSAETYLETLLYAFSNYDKPETGLTAGPDGFLYGTTYAGGSANEGTLFKVDTSGHFTLLHNFGDGTVNNDGQNPMGNLVLASNGDFYGTTSAGGSAGNGAVFKMTPAGAVSILHSFGDGTVPDDGSDPESGLIQATNGDLYGTTYNGGRAGYGTVYQITPAGAVSILYHFNDGSTQYDGENPQSALVQASNGKLYGTTYTGGLGFYGTLFSIGTSGGSSYDLLYAFSGAADTTDGQNPMSPMIQGKDGNLYGMTVGGGKAAYGAIYRLTPAGEETIIHSFSDGTVAFDGADPEDGLLLASDGMMYGATMGSDIFGSYGTVFRTDTSGNVTILHAFGDGSVNGDGNNPQGSLIQVGTELFGTCSTGGPSDDYSSGTIFSLAANLPPATPPTAPTDLAATAGDGQVTLSWKAGAGAASYNVYRGTATGGEGASPVKTGITSTSTAVTGLTNGVKYYFVVKSVNPYGTSANSNEASATPVAVIPATPTGLKATAGNAEITLTWTADADATSYEVYKGTSSGGENPNPVKTAVTGTTVVIGGLTNFTTYYFKIKAVGAAGTSKASAEVSAKPVGAPFTPADLTATGGNAEVTLHWTADAGATSYEVYKGTSSGGENPNPVKTGVTGTSVSITGLTNGTTYYFKIKAVNSYGVSKASNEASAKPS